MFGNSKRGSDGGRYIRSRAMGTGSSQEDFQMPSYDCDDDTRSSGCNSTNISVTSHASAFSERSRHSASTHRSLGSYSSHGSTRSRASASLVASQNSRDRRKQFTHAEECKQSSDHFGAHAVGIESISIASLSTMIGSMMMDPRKEKQMLREKRRSNQLLRELRRSASANSCSTPSLSENEPNVPSASPHSMHDRCPIDYKQMQRIIEQDGDSLPRPRVETERKIADFVRNQSATSTPVELPTMRPFQHHDPPVAVAHSSDDVEYLSRLYDLRTWNMYKLINETRSNQDQPQHIQDRHSTHHTNERIQPQCDMTTMSSHSMMFEIDME